MAAGGIQIFFLRKDPVTVRNRNIPDFGQWRPPDRAAELDVKLFSFWIQNVNLPFAVRVPALTQQIRDQAPR